MLNTLENLIKLARDRKSSPVEGSYTNKLLTDKSLSKAKVLEEVNELIEAVDENSNKIKYLPDLEDLNFLIRNILKISNEEYLEIISQSIPEKNPILYTETSLKIP